MALTRTQTLLSYRSQYGGQAYLFDIQIDEQGVLGVRNIRTPLGLIQDALTRVPQAVLNDIQTALSFAGDVLAETQIATGTITFTGQTSITEALDPSLLNNANYRVILTPPDDVPWQVLNKTTTSFDAVFATAYGSGAIPLDVDYVVLVSAAQSSSTSGVLTFTAGDAGSKAVAFTTAFASNAYRVVLTEGGFFKARVLNKTRTGFTVQIGITISDPTTVTVGYDVFAS